MSDGPCVSLLPVRQNWSHKSPSLDPLGCEEHDSYWPKWQPLVFPRQPLKHQLQKDVTKLKSKVKIFSMLFLVPLCLYLFSYLCDFISQYKRLYYNIYRTLIILAHFSVYSYMILYFKTKFQLQLKGMLFLDNDLSNIIL